jgi:hypothetical protein
MGTSGPQVRASDADRAATADSLRAHCAAGRLEVGELEERVAAALAARTLDELDVLVQDLPAERRTSTPVQTPTRGRMRIGLPGVRGFHQQHELHVKRDRVFREVRQHIVPGMVAAGYNVIASAENELLVFERDRDRVVVSLSESGDTATRLTVQGAAPRHIRKAFANIA